MTKKKITLALIILISVNSYAQDTIKNDVKTPLNSTYPSGHERLL